MVRRTGDDSFHDNINHQRTGGSVNNSIPDGNQFFVNKSGAKDDHSIQQTGNLADGQGRFLFLERQDQEITASCGGVL